MSVTSLIVRKSDSAIRGYVVTKAAVAGDANDDYVQVAQSVIDDFEAKRSQMMAEGRSPFPTWNGSACVIPTDDRPHFKVESNKAEIAADGIDSCILTFTKLMADGVTTQTGFNATVKGKFPFGERTKNLSLTFANGVATKLFRTTISGTFELHSTALFRLQAPLAVEAYE